MRPWRDFRAGVCGHTRKTSWQLAVGKEKKKEIKEKGKKKIVGKEKKKEKKQDKMKQTPLVIVLIKLLQKFIPRKGSPDPAWRGRRRRF